MEQERNTQKDKQMNARCVYVYTNEEELSRSVGDSLRQLLAERGIRVPACFDDTVELLVCIGGDGTLLRGLHAFDFPDIPVAGINTGHLGFFQELQHDELHRLLDMCDGGSHSIQRHRLVRVTLLRNGGEPVCHKGLNDIVIKGSVSRITHLNLSIGDSFVEKFSGDGLVIASPAGSTAYNYSLGGSIVDPRLNLLQVTPIAPMNTTAFRCFTSSIVLPPDLEINIVPEFPHDRDVLVIVDGVEYTYQGVSKIIVDLSFQEVQLVRFQHYDFWNKVKSKFLQ